jgi:pyruvate dehydrogenase E1 component beta subunit
LLYQQQVRTAGEAGQFKVEVADDLYPTIRLHIAGAPAAQVTMAAYGYSAELAGKAMVELAYQHEIFAEMILFSQLSPLPLQTLTTSLGRTGRLLTVEEGVHRHGWGAEVAAAAAEELQTGFRLKRVAAQNMPVPASGPLEQAVLPSQQDIIEASRALLQA